MSYEEALKMQVAYLLNSLARRRGVEQGYLTYNSEGDVVSRIGRVSYNPQWYRDFYAEYGRKPTTKDIHLIAETQLAEGYWSEEGYIPPFSQWSQMVFS